MRLALRSCCGLSLIAGQLSAQSLPADSLFDHLIGGWVLSGTIARQQTTDDVTFAGSSAASMCRCTRSRGSVAGDSIPLLFHYSATDRFHTTFVYHRATDSWLWHMDNDSAGVRRPFARVTLTRERPGR